MWPHNQGIFLSDTGLVNGMGDGDRSAFIERLKTGLSNILPSSKQDVCQTIFFGLNF
jgi:hypothetical protein